MGDTDQENDYVLAFDHFYTNNHIQILKALLPFIGADNMPLLPVMIKYMELRYTLSLVQSGHRPLSQIFSASTQEHGQGFPYAAKESLDPERIYHSIKKYLAPNEEKSFKQVINLMHTMSNVKEMQQMMEMFQNMSSETDSAQNVPPNLSALEGMLGDNVNLAEMMQLFQSMQN